MNYIRHLNSAFGQFAKDQRLNPTHISLYIALFQLWNMNRFPKSFLVNREETMSLSKIGSRTTYHRCLTDLNNWNYVFYMPSHNAFKGSRIKMPIFGTTDGQAVDKHETSGGQAVVSYTNINKQNININKPKLPKSENEVLYFFEKEKWPANEGKKFFNHYASIGWKLGGKIAIVDWHSTARNWMLKADEIEKEKTANKPSQNTALKISKGRDNLKITKDKDYGQPL